MPARTAKVPAYCRQRHRGRWAEWRLSSSRNFKQIAVFGRYTSSDALLNLRPNFRNLRKVYVLKLTGSLSPGRILANATEDGQHRTQLWTTEPSRAACLFQFALIVVEV